MRIILALLLLTLTALAGNVVKTNSCAITGTTIDGVACSPSYVRSLIPTNAVIIAAVDRSPRQPTHMTLIWHQPAATNYSVQTFYGTNAYTKVVRKNP